VTSEEGEGDQLLPTTTGGETTCNNQLQFKAAVAVARQRRQHGGRGSTGAEAVEVVAAGARRHGGGGGDVRVGVGGPLFFCQLLLSCSLWRHIIYHIHMGIRSVCTYLRTYVVCLWSVNVGKWRHKSVPTQ